MNKAGSSTYGETVHSRYRPNSGWGRDLAWTSVVNSFGRGFSWINPRACGVRARRAEPSVRFVGFRESCDVLVGGSANQAGQGVGQQFENAIVPSGRLISGGGKASRLPIVLH